MKIIKGGIADKNGSTTGINIDSIIRRIKGKPSDFCKKIYKYYKESLT